MREDVEGDEERRQEGERGDAPRRHRLVSRRGTAATSGDRARLSRERGLSSVFPRGVDRLVVGSKMPLNPDTTFIPTSNARTIWRRELIN